MKHSTITIYYPHSDHKISDGNLGAYINQLLTGGVKVIQIVNGYQPHTDHEHEVAPPTEYVYTAIQGNVGSS